MNIIDKKFIAMVGEDKKLYQVELSSELAGEEAEVSNLAVSNFEKFTDILTGEYGFYKKYGCEEADSIFDFARDSLDDNEFFLIFKDGQFLFDVARNYDYNSSEVVCFSYHGLEFFPITGYLEYIDEYGFILEELNSCCRGLFISDNDVNELVDLENDRRVAIFKKNEQEVRRLNKQIKKLKNQI